MTARLLPLQGEVSRGDGDRSARPLDPHPHPAPPLEREGTCLFGHWSLGHSLLGRSLVAQSLGHSSLCHLLTFYSRVPLLRRAALPHQLQLLARGLAPGRI